MNTLSRPNQKLYALFVFTLIFLPAHMSHAQIHKEFTPTISIIEEYDDNIYLSDRNEISSYITMTSPGFNFNFLAQHTQLELEYAPTFVWYSEESVDSEVRHLGTLTFGQDLTEHIRFDLTDTYTHMLLQTLLPKSLFLLSEAKRGMKPKIF